MNHSADVKSVAPNGLQYVTPRAVWVEYARRKAELDPSMGAQEYEQAVQQVVAELGCDVPQDELSDAQRLAQSRAIEAFREVER